MIAEQTMIRMICFKDIILNFPQIFHAFNKIDHRLIYLSLSSNISIVAGDS